MSEDGEDDAEHGPAPGSDTAVLPVRAKGVSLWRQGRALVDGVNLKIGQAHGVSVILGPNGAGKSLLLKLLANLIRPDAGQVTWGGSAPDRARATRIGVVFQRPVLLHRSVLANVDFALSLRPGIAAVERAHRAVAALEAARLSHLSNRPARALSGGEQQRLALARARVLEPEVLFLDEPTANLDPQATAALEEMISEAAAATPVVLVTHDLAQARRVATRVLFMHNGRILERTRRDPFFESPQTEAARRFLNGEIVL